MQQNGNHPFQFVAMDVHPFYINCAELEQHPAYLSGVHDALADLVRNNVDLSRVAQISGGESRDWIFSRDVAKALHLPHLSMRKEQKTYGIASNFIAGKITPGEYIVHIADLLTVGTSATQWIEVIEGNKGVVDSYFVVFDRMQGGVEALARRTPSIGVHSLAQMTPEFFEIGIREGALTQELYESIMNEYLPNPKEWGLNYLMNHPEEIAYLIETNGVGLLTQGYSAHQEELLNRAKPYLKDYEGTVLKV